MLRKIHHNRNATWHFQRLMGVPLTPYHRWAENHCGNKHCRYQVLLIWRKHHRHAHRRWKRVGTAPVASASGYYDSKYAGLRCIHTHEGAWNANTGNGYYGGLQMDSSFMSTYGPTYLRSYGTADKWPPIDQLRAAYKAVQSRGYQPWPNTARMCGLL